MQCEICGTYIEKGKKIKVEGSIVVVCDNCINYGEFVSEIKPYEPLQKINKEITPYKEEFEIKFTEDLIEDFSKIIREKREKIGMKQEELAKKLNEPVSLIHRIEIGKFEPSLKLTRKIEKILNVKLLEKVEESISEPSNKNKTTEGLTLGDLVIVRKKIKKK